MSYHCPVCSETIESDLIKFQQHTDQHIINLVKKDHPDWVDTNGVCKKCYEYYRAEIKGTSNPGGGSNPRGQGFGALWGRMKDFFSGK